MTTVHARRKEGLFWIGYSAVRSVSAEYSPFTNAACKSDRWEQWKQRGARGGDAAGGRGGVQYVQYVQTSAAQTHKQTQTSSFLFLTAHAIKLWTDWDWALKWVFLLFNQRQKAFEQKQNAALFLQLLAWQCCCCCCGCCSRILRWLRDLSSAGLSGSRTNHRSGRSKATWFENGGGVRSPLRTDLYHEIWAPTVHISFAGSKTLSVLDLNTYTLGFTTLWMHFVMQCAHMVLYMCTRK